MQGGASAIHRSNRPPNSFSSLLHIPIVEREIVARPVAASAVTREAGSERAMFTDYFRCPAHLATFDTRDNLSAAEGYFVFGNGVCYGRPSNVHPRQNVADALPDVSASVECHDGRVYLPCDLSEVITNLRQERYARASHHFLENVTASDAVRDVYYFLRPILSVGVRKHLQRIRLRGWERIAFPEWPVDVTVETLMRHCMTLLLQNGMSRLPFIWFWPDGMSSCLMLTHDVEGRAGVDFCGSLMDLDESFGFTSAFQLIPEARGQNSHGLAGALRARGFEVNIHDLNHDGYLFHSRDQFLTRAVQINGYVQEYECRGFRSGAMYREQDWFDAFEFSYDMSVPNVAHLEPQRGGCCTVMPYFVGKILELPLTTVQDYSLFHILGDYSTKLWRTQIDLILAHNGLVSVLAHPDYLVEKRARAVYRELLGYLGHLRDEGKVWIALPGDVDRWWRNRRQDGPGGGRRWLAYRGPRQSPGASRVRHARERSPGLHTVDRGSSDRGVSRVKRVLRRPAIERLHACPLAGNVSVLRGQTTPSETRLRLTFSSSRLSRSLFGVLRSEDDLAAFQTARGFWAGWCDVLSASRFSMVAPVWLVAPIWPVTS